MCSSLSCTRIECGSFCPLLPKNPLGNQKSTSHATTEALLMRDALSNSEPPLFRARDLLQKRTPPINQDARLSGRTQMNGYWVIMCLWVSVSGKGTTRGTNNSCFCFKTFQNCCCRILWLCQFSDEVLGVLTGRTKAHSSRFIVCGKNVMSEMGL